MGGRKGGVTLARSWQEGKTWNSGFFLLGRDNKELMVDVAFGWKTNNLCKIFGCIHMLTSLCMLGAADSELFTF